MTHIWKTLHMTCFHESEKGTLRVESLAQEQNIMVRASRPYYEGKWNVGKVKAKSIHLLHLWDNTIIIMMIIIIIIIVIIIIRRMITIIVIQFI